MKTLAGAVVALAVAIAGCGAPPNVASPSAAGPTAHGTIVVSYEPRDAPSQVFNGNAHVRIVDDRGSIAAQDILTDGVRLVVPVGTYGVEVVFVYVSDWMSCGPDPAVAGQQTCFLPSLSPVPGCSAAQVAVGRDSVVTVRHRIVADGSCRLDAGADPAGPSPT